MTDIHVGQGSMLMEHALTMVVMPILQMKTLKLRENLNQVTSLIPTPHNQPSVGPLHSSWDAPRHPCPCPMVVPLSPRHTHLCQDFGAPCLSFTLFLVANLVLRHETDPPT